MASDSIQCPVCGETMSAYTPYCPSCSFDIHILPNEAPHAVQEMENQRVRYAKNTLLRMKSPHLSQRHRLQWRRRGMMDFARDAESPSFSKMRTI